MQTVIDWLLAVMSAIGAPGVGVATALETVFPPIPSEMVLPLAGFTAYEGRYGVVAAVVWATVGSVVGALILYYAGRVWGLERIYRIVDRMPLVDRSDVEKGMESFARHGRSAVLVGRLVPGVRSVISIPAGVDRMPVPTFLLWTTIGSTAWNSLLIGLGYALGSRWHVVEAYVDRASNVVYVALLLAVVTWLARRIRHRRVHAREQGAPSDPVATVEETRTPEPVGATRD